MKHEPVTEVIKTQGMFCQNCEKRIENTLAHHPGVISAKASFPDERVEVTYNPTQVDGAALRRVIEALGYETKADGGRYLQIVSILLIVLAIYVIAAHLGWTQVFNIFPSIETSVSLGMLFVIGLMTSVHCIAMCGGINLTQSAMAAKGGNKLVGENLRYNAGRVISYTLIGALAGGIGSAISFSGTMRGVVCVAAGALMVLMALNMLGVFKPLRRLKLHWPNGLYAAAGKALRGKSSLVIGLLNGLMPCGPLQSMQIYALSTGSAVKGGLSMLLFSLGTVPLMFGFGFFAGRLNRRFARYMLTVSALLIFVMGIHMAGNGLSLAGVSLPSVSDDAAVTAMEQDGVQHVRTQVDYGSYQPISVKQNVPVQWTVYVPPGRLNGCNGEIIIPAYDMQIKLSEGDNVISFTPTEPGTVPYSCWMGMIKSSITVTE